MRTLNGYQVPVVLSKYHWPLADMIFVKKFTPPDFQAKDFTPLISLNFNSFSDKNTKQERFWRNLHHWQKFYTAGGSDGSDKSHLWQEGGGSVREMPKRR